MMNSSACKLGVLLLVLNVPPCLLADSSPDFPKDIPIPSECKQLLFMKTPKAKSIQGEVSRFVRDTESWRKVGNSWPAVVGRNGIVDPAIKKEGDGNTPSGLYPIGLAFGYAKTLDTKLKYRQVQEDDLWIDDPNSPDYNRWVKAPTRAKSFEFMKRKDILYKLGAVIEYNTNPVKAGKGSAIFLHIWPASDKPTAGCVALAEKNLAELLAWMDEAQQPHILIQTVGQR
ncbi:MAG: L,D-transpeptidase [Planctomycetia bacterium]|jgi:L,D-peptidoglycan transpeptidase YkuD (ErfK/YbiS/YcfS/YnhG family)